MAEATDLKSVKYGFESHGNHQFMKILIALFALCLLTSCATAPSRTVPREEWTWEKADFKMPDVSNMPHVDDDTVHSYTNATQEEGRHMIKLYRVNYNRR